ncbi:MAG: hypothetical protein ACYDHN_07390, partial [Solirubrobacteraceae bacterium]
SYEYFAPTERYEVDFSTLCVLGGLSAWLSLTAMPRRYLSRTLRVCGGLLALWGCASGLAISFAGTGRVLAAKDPHTWRTLEDITSPISTVIAHVVGRPVLAQLTARELVEPPTTSINALEIGATEFSLSSGEGADLTVVSPGRRQAGLSALIQHQPGADGIEIDGPGSAVHRYGLPQEEGVVILPVGLHGGVNRLRLSPVLASGEHFGPSAPVLFVKNLAIAHK